MSSNFGPKNKIAKRFRVNLWGRPRDPLAKKKESGGGSFQKRTRKKSEYGLRLDEKQKLKFFYGSIREHQFNHYYKKAKQKGGNIGNNFILLLEKRLDVIVYRMNLVPTIFAAKQIVSHGHILVNEKKINICSYLVKKDDVIRIKGKSKEIPLIKTHLEHPEREVPLYLTLDSQKISGKLDRLPEREDIYYPFELNESLIIEFYSR